MDLNPNHLLISDFRFIRGHRQWEGITLEPYSAGREVAFVVLLECLDDRLYHSIQHHWLLIFLLTLKQAEIKALLDLPADAINYRLLEWMCSIPAGCDPKAKVDAIIAEAKGCAVNVLQGPNQKERMVEALKPPLLCWRVYTIAKATGWELDFILWDLDLTIIHQFDHARLWEGGAKTTKDALSDASSIKKLMLESAKAKPEYDDATDD